MSKFATDADRAAVVEVGSGPTLYAALAVGDLVKNICLADLSPHNLREIQKWVSRDPAMFDWREHTRLAVTARGKDASEDEVAAYEDRLRSKIAWAHCDIRRMDPMGMAYRRSCRTIISLFCADSITDDQRAWRRYMNNILRLACPGSLVIFGALLDCRHYTDGALWYPSANLTMSEICDFLATSRLEVLDIRRRDVGPQRDKGYSAIALACVRMRV